MSSVSFIIPGQPMGQARHRTAVLKHKNGDPVRCKKTGRILTSNYDDPNSKSAKALVQAHAARAMAEKGLKPFQGAVQFEITTIFLCPKTYHRKTKPAPRILKTTKPDFDNLEKLVADACSGIVYPDDAQVAISISRKYRGAQGEAPRTEVTFREITEEV